MPAPKLMAQGLRNLPKSAQADLAERDQYANTQGIAKMLRRDAERMYDNPLVNTAIGLTPVVGDIQSGFEAVNSARKGNYGEAALNALGVLPFVPALGAMTVWHGSPHKFDKFDMSKIGTGEGAQAYGHGLYFAESPEVAKGYQDKLANPSMLIDGVTTGEYLQKTGNPIFSHADIYHYDGLSKDQIIKKLSDARQFEASRGNKYQKDSDYQQVINTLENAKNIGREDAGALYKTDIPDEAVARFLDWDKPLSEQAPEVQAALRSNPNYEKYWLEHLERRASARGENPTAEDLYRYLGDDFDKQEITDILRSQGIPGIRYLDQGSRGTGQGTSNFVLFDDQMPRILEINGQPTGALPWSPGEWGGAAKQVPKVDDYGIAHRPPGPEGGAPLHDLTGGGQVYPDDVYSKNAVQYYGTGDRALDSKSFRIINSYKNNPDAPVTIYRAVPTNVPESAGINAGDWVTINPDYAKMHGESALDGDYRILKSTVPASSIYTNGDSIHEFGYWPSDVKKGIFE